MGLFRRTPGVPVFADYTRYKPYLKVDFRTQCAYCEVTEGYRGGDDDFGADHFRPKKSFPELASHYPNLYYCCNTCNRSKGFVWPSKEEHEAGHFFVDPCVSDPYEEHIRIDSDGNVSAKTRAGEFTIEHLKLRRPACVRFRKRRRWLQERIAQLTLALGSFNPDDPGRLLAEDVLSDYRADWEYQFASTVPPPR